MENQTVPNPTPEPLLTSAQPSEQKTKFPAMYSFLSLVSLALLTSTAFLYYQNMQLKNMLGSYQAQQISGMVQSSPTPSAVAATLQHIWDINSGDSKNSANIYVFAIWKGTSYSNGVRTVFFEVDIQNRSQDLIKISPSDFSLLDESGKEVGTVLVNGSESRESPFIPDKHYLDPQRQISGNITFTGIPDNLQKGTLVFQPEVLGSKSVEFPMSFVLPVTR